MALTSIELIDALRQAARGIEKGDLSPENSLPIEQIINEIKACELPAPGIEQLESLRNAAKAPSPSRIVNYFRHCADALEKQLLAMLDLPVDISFLRNAA